MNIFITGTDTDVGKTVVTAGISAVMQGLGYSIGVYKPVQSGAIVKNGFLMSPDIAFVKSIDPNIEAKCTYNFVPATAPSLAAEIDNVKIDKELILNDFDNLTYNNDITIVEGAGGLMVPIDESYMMTDLIKDLDIPIVIVARPDLGTINHTLLTINVAKNLGIKIQGVIINNYPVNTCDPAIVHAPDTIKELGDVELLGVLPSVPLKGNMLNAEILVENVINNINLSKLFDIEIPRLHF